MSNPNEITREKAVIINIAEDRSVCVVRKHKVRPNASLQKCKVITTTNPTRPPTNLPENDRHRVLVSYAATCNQLAVEKNSNLNLCCNNNNLWCEVHHTEARSVANGSRLGLGRFMDNFLRASYCHALVINHIWSRLANCRNKYTSLT
uniref:Uncharacterized protein n=1 Tax=Oryza brachyantha TaxID=4533 RepID=J3MP18_ORYBR